MQLATTPWASSARTSSGAVPDTWAFATSPRHSCKASSSGGPFGPPYNGVGCSAQHTRSAAPTDGRRLFVNQTRPIGPLRSVSPATAAMLFEPGGEVGGVLVDASV